MDAGAVGKLLLRQAQRLAAGLDRKTETRADVRLCLLFRLFGESCG
jgi:hypothetical protein